MQNNNYPIKAAKTLVKYIQNILDGNVLYCYAGGCYGRRFHNNQREKCIDMALICKYNEYAMNI